MRSIELSLVEDVSIHVRGVSPPTNLTHQTTAQLFYDIISVCHHNGFTYVCTSTGVNKIDDLGNTVTSFGWYGLFDMVTDLCIYKEKVYILAFNRIDGYDIEGHHITSWGYSTTSNDNNRLVVTGDKVIILDSCKKQLEVYSLDGQFVKSIKFRQAGGWPNVALCASDQESVVISSFSTSAVFRVHLETEKVIWTFKDIAEPGGIACYKQEHVLVASLGEIHVLEAKSGKHLGKLVDHLIVSKVIHLDIADDTVIVADPDEKQVLIYELSS